jgi:hypothetical protein
VERVLKLRDDGSEIENTSGVYRCHKIGGVLERSVEYNVCVMENSIVALPFMLHLRAARMNIALD